VGAATVARPRRCRHQGAARLFRRVAFAAMMR
jgi:hypothetical protein